MAEPQLGLRANARPFALLVLVNAFVGTMAGMERSILPALAEQGFGLRARTAILTFLIGFGLAKAGANLLAGHLSQRHGRKPVLVLGWIIGLPVPLMLAFGPSWGWIVAANLLLGLNQGLCWSTAVIMKIDLAGPKRRGLAMGLNEFAGYAAVALMALVTGWIAARHGLRPWPFLLGFAFALIGLFLSVIAVGETKGHAALEGGAKSELSSREVVRLGSYADPALSTLSWVGMVNNLNDGLAWGILPLFFAAQGLGLSQIGLLAALYPASWSVAQLGTGWLSDHWGRRPLIAWGMIVQAFALAALPWLHGMEAFAADAILLGLGTAMVYPTLLAAVGDRAHAGWRPMAVGVYRLWRDGGYVIGALLAGVVADLLGLQAAILAVAGLTGAAGLLAGLRLPASGSRGNNPAQSQQPVAGSR